MCVCRFTMHAFVFGPQELNMILEIFERSKEEGGAGLHSVHIDEIYQSATRFQVQPCSFHSSLCIKTHDCAA